MLAAPKPTPDRNMSSDPMTMHSSAIEVQAHSASAPTGGPAPDESAHPRKLVGVVPAAAASVRRELLGTLEQVFPVRFQGLETDDVEGVEGVLVIGDGKISDHGLPTGITEMLAQGCPCLSVSSGHASLATPGVTIALAEDAQLAQLLRGRELPEECAPDLSVATPLEGDRVLAQADGRPVWWRRPGTSWTHHSVFGLQELAAGEALRDRLRGGHFMGLLPLLHLLRHVCRDLEWEERPLSAAFVVDDPNLHAGSYGYLNYRELIAHAERHSYHVGLATVPLDGWMCSEQVASLIRDSPKAVSLLMHGNSHLAGELGRLTDERLAVSSLAQAMCRVSAFERRSGIPVERVMAPPHELCSTAALAAMFRLGFEGACIGRRHPWRDRDSLARLTDARLLKWHPTDLMDAGLPIVPRRPIDYSRDDLVFAALLRQPLILFAHHWDFADGMDVLEQAANEINGFGDVRWGSVGSIARNCFFTKRVGETLHVQMHARRVVVGVPDGVNVVRVATSSLVGDEPQRQLISDAADVRLASTQRGWVSDPLPAGPGASLELKLTSAHPLDPSSVPHPKPTPWPIVRRLLVEGRDRARPWLRR
jgi:hypothetical protein